MGRHWEVALKSGRPFEDFKKVEEQVRSSMSIDQPPVDELPNKDWYRAT